MNISKKIGKMLSRYKKNRAIRKKQRKVHGLLKGLDHTLKLSKEQTKEIQDFWFDMIGEKINLDSHRYFYSRTGHYSKEYVPMDLYHFELVPKANVRYRAGTFSEKNLFDLFFPGENLVHIILKNINGYYYYEGRPVSEEEAIELCSNMDEVIIKPSFASKGHGVQLFSSKDGVTTLNNKTVAKLFKDYKKNFLIQPRIKQHKDMSALNPTSVNTIRVLSYRSGMEVLIIYSVVRIGRNGAVIDNQSAGGISTAIDKEGRLFPTAFGGYAENDITHTDSGVELKGYQIPSYDKVIEFVKRLHMKMPFFNILGWDVAIQEDGNPVLIEFNTNPGLSQSAFGPGMGDYTERIVRELWPRPNSWFRG